MSEDSESVVLKELLGEIVWGATRSIGSYVTLEFGTPHLEVRQPKDETRSTEPRIRELMARRRVWARGAAHLWVEDCHWQLSTGGRQCDSDSPSPTMESLLEELNGQVLVSAVLRSGPERWALRLEFDLGGVFVMTWETVETTDDVAVSVWRVDGHVTTFNVNGTVGRDQVPPPQQPPSRL